MTTIYVVFGRTGEYSDRNEWLVAAYRSEFAAAQRVASAEQWAKENGFGFGEDVVDYDSREALEEGKVANPYDAAMNCDYTGVRYYFAPVEMVDA